MRTIHIKTASVLKPALQPSRYKGLYGGRGGMKSYFFADLLIDYALTHNKFRAVCVREIQNTLRDSAKRLIESRLDYYGLSELDGFIVRHDRIITPGGGEIIFRGMTDATAENIKSLEGVDVAWVEEAQTLSKRSLQLLRPTIRKSGSELWFSWNPRFETDPVDELLRKKTPSGAVVIRVNWSDNPWFPLELDNERRETLRNDPELYDHIWEGGYVKVIEGAYYARQINQARLEGRIPDFLYPDQVIAKHAFVDIGGTGHNSDAFAMWIAQIVGKEIRILDYYEAIGQQLQDHVYWLRKRGHDQAKIHLPHDGKKSDAVYRVSYESEFRRGGFAVDVVPLQGKGAAMARINALRKIFPACTFHGENCKAGLDALGWYHPKYDSRGMDLGPDHDFSSHAADAAGLMALVVEDVMRQQESLARKPRSGVDRSASWLG